MPVNIVCCIKQVPDTAQVKIDPDTNTLIRSGVESICNPYDLVAAEAAVQLTEKYGGQVTVISMGPPQAAVALRECLSLGDHRAILLSDRAFAGADTLATSYTLAQSITAIAAAEPVHLVLCGKQAIDGDTAQTGPGVATRLGFCQLTYVSEIVEVDPEGGTITVRREVEGGSEVVEAKLPAMLTLELEMTTARYASLPELVRSLRQEVEVWGASEIKAEPEYLGLTGSPTSVRQISSPPPRQGGPVYDVIAEKDKAVEDFLGVFFDKERDLLGELLGPDEG